MFTVPVWEQSDGEHLRRCLLHQILPWNDQYTQRMETNYFAQWWVILGTNSRLARFSVGLQTKRLCVSAGYVHSRVEEEYLWDCKQLGAFSPGVLLNTLLYFFTKFFNYKTVEQHRCLSFANVKRYSRGPANCKVSYLRFYPPKEDTSAGQWSVILYSLKKKLLRIINFVQFRWCPSKEEEEGRWTAKDIKDTAECRQSSPLSRQAIRVLSLKMVCQRFGLFIVSMKWNLIGD